MKPIDADKATQWVSASGIFKEVGCSKNYCRFLKESDYSNCDTCAVNGGRFGKYSKLVRILHETY